MEVELQILDGVKPQTVIRVVEHVSASHDLTCTLRGTLVSYPGSVHWHFKQGGQKGTLEITWWERERRLWFKVAEGRKSQWIMDSICQLKEQIEQLLL